MALESPVPPTSAANGHPGALYTLTRRNAWLVLAALHLIVVIAIAGGAHRGKVAAENEAARSSAESARLLMEKVADIIDTVDGSLKLIIAEITAADLGAMVAPERRRQIENILRQHKAGFKQIANIGLTNADGVALYVAEGKAGFRVDDRRYYQFLRSTPAAETAVSEFIRIRGGSNEPAILLARRIRDTEKPFLGLAMTPVKLAFFEDIISHLQLGERGAAALYAPDLVMLGRRPALPDLLGKRLPEHERVLAMLGNREKGTFELVSPADGQRRLYSFHRTPVHGLVTVIGQSEAEYLADWRTAVWWYFGGYLLFAVISAMYFRRWLGGRLREIEAMEAARVDSERYRDFHALTESLTHPLLVVRKSDRVVLHANESTARSLGIEEADLLDKSVDVLLDEGERHRIDQLLEAQDTEIRLRRPDGSSFWALVTATPVAFGGEEAFMIGVFDIDERKAREDELAYRAHYDGLTQIYSRTYFMERFTASFAHAVRLGRPLAVIAFDLDHFKKVNDTHGHAAGDEALRTAVAATKSVLREADLLGRIGGEEFVAVTASENAQDALQIAERIRVAIATRAVEIEAGEAFNITASLGVAMLSEIDSSAEQLLARADAALYDAKHAGRNRVSVR